MTEDGEKVRFYPRDDWRSTPREREWLAGLNRRLDSSEELDFPAAREVARHWGKIDISASLERKIEAILGNHFGLPPIATRDEQAALRSDIDAALEFDRFGVDPFLALADYRGTDWGETIASFLTRKREKPVNLRFAGFWSLARSAVLWGKSRSFEGEARWMKENMERKNRTRQSLFELQLSRDAYFQSALKARKLKGEAVLVATRLLRLDSAVVDMDKLSARLCQLPSVNLLERGSIAAISLPKENNMGVTIVINGFLVPRKGR